MKDLKLKRCPFFGGEPELRYQNTYGTIPTYFVRCQLCGSIGTVHYVGTSVPFKDRPGRAISKGEAERAAIENWNRRAGEAKAI